MPHLNTPKEFIEEGTGFSSIQAAIWQQDNLLYFTESTPEDNVNFGLFREGSKIFDKEGQFSHGFFKDRDPLIRWVSWIFGDKPLESFIKYLRFPVVSSSLIKDRVIPHLERVFFSEDGFEHFFINREDVKMPEGLNSQAFKKKVFKDILFRFNDIYWHDILPGMVNEPFRHRIPLEWFVAIDSNEVAPERVAWKTMFFFEEDKSEDAFVYADAFQYAVFDKEFTREIIIPHDLGRCPAIWVSPEPFGTRNNIIRKSIFSNARTQIEQFVFFNTLLSFIGPNGWIPKAVTFKTNPKTKENAQGQQQGPVIDNAMDSRILMGGNIRPSDFNLLSPGTSAEIDVKINPKDGSYDTTLAQNFINYFQIPTEVITSITTRIEDLQREIISTLVGDFTEMQRGREQAVNEAQVNRGFVTREDKIRRFGGMINKTKQQSDEIFLGLKHGINNVVVDQSMGTDYFIESQKEIFDLISKASNPIERQQLIIRGVKNQSRFNEQKQLRNTILYSLLPFAADKDFDKARDSLDDLTESLQLRFSYWIVKFEARWGDITLFWLGLGEMPNAEKLMLLQSLLFDEIKDERRKISDAGGETRVETEGTEES